MGATPGERPAATAPFRGNVVLSAHCADSRVGRPLRKLSRRVVPRAAAACGRPVRRDLPLRPHRRRHRRRGRRVRRRTPGRARRITSARSTRIAAGTPPDEPPFPDLAAAIARARAAARAVSRSPVGVPAGRDDARGTRPSSVCSTIAAARPIPIGRLLLHLYGADTAANLARERRDLHGAAARQLLAGHRGRLAEADGSTCRRRTSRASASPRPHRRRALRRALARADGVRIGARARAARIGTPADARAAVAARARAARRARRRPPDSRRHRRGARRRVPPPTAAVAPRLGRRRPRTRCFRRAAIAAHREGTA